MLKPLQKIIFGLSLQGVWETKKPINTHYAYVKMCEEL